MRKALILVLILAIFCGWRWQNKKKPAIKIGRIGISASEFKDAFRASSFAGRKGSSAINEFLDSFISRKLMLREAEKEGLDKEPQFLKDVQLFWEQSLLKRIIAKKIKELSTNIKIEEKAIQDYYSQHKDKDFAGKSLAEARDKINWLLVSRQRAKALRRWTDSLREKVNIDIDYDALGIEENRGR